MPSPVGILKDVVIARCVVLSDGTFLEPHTMFCVSVDPALQIGGLDRSSTTGRRGPDAASLQLPYMICFAAGPRTMADSDDMGIKGYFLEHKFGH